MPPKHKSSKVAPTPHKATATGCRGAGCFRGLSVYFFSGCAFTVPVKTLKQLVTSNGGEVVPSMKGTHAVTTPEKVAQGFAGDNDQTISRVVSEHFITACVEKGRVSESEYVINS
eukprot:NODE_6992_length_478_cov_11.920228_g6826_i0.p1 GENE.NODE_6992_length_478_cov_11.920228_g6826_i0~~NODE_6992_length_478_cov_11.920228_g6826_i0.p1  ORF type:complete len:128 (+),score=45.23 NODE_6992_length_478_cov_11.920228_g6826_i0:40-384(+)